MNDYIGQFLVGIALYIIVATTAAIRALSTMKEQIKTLFTNTEKNEKDIKNLEAKLSNKFDTILKEIQRNNQLFVQMVNDLKVEVVQKKDKDN